MAVSRCNDIDGREKQESMPAPSYASQVGPLGRFESKMRFQKGLLLSAPGAPRSNHAPCHTGNYFASR